MNEAKLYYTAPPESQFRELKLAAELIWKNYNDPYSADKKAEHVKGIGNVRDNFMYIVAMFDPNNQRKLSRMISEETRKAVSDRYVSGGGDPIYNYFEKGILYQNENLDFLKSLK